MPELESYLTDLARTNLSGAVFLFSFGVTWLVCGLLWYRLTPRTAALITLFQGMVALPVALSLSAGLGMFDERPGGALMTQLSLVVAMSQLLVLPLLIVLHARRNYAAIPLIFSLAGAVHFVPYAWLYQTPAYLVMSAVLALGLAVLYGIDPTDREQENGLISARGAGRVCVLTGAVLVATGALLTLQHL